jgi:hypothetical protein
MTIRKLLFFGALAALAGACTDPGFTPVSRLDKLRVLALKLTPVNPAQGESTTVEPLVYAPSGQASAYSWSWCPFQGNSADGYACPFTDAQVQQLAAGLGATEAPPPLDLGHDPTASFKNVFPPAALAAVCAQGMGEFKPDCDGGYPVRVKVTVDNGGESTIATVIIRLPTDASVPSNQNPSIAGMEAILDGQARSIDESGEVSLPRLVETSVHARVDASASEDYQRLDRQNQPVMAKERLILSWFSEQGDIRHAQTEFIDGSTPLETALENQLEPGDLDDDPNASSRVIVVVRDNRGGVAWASGVVKLQELP